MSLDRGLSILRGMSFDRGLSIGLFLFSGWIAYESTKIPRTAIRQTVGPEAVPLGFALVLMLGSVLLFIRTLRVKGRDGGEEVVAGTHVDWRTQFMVLLGIAVYLVLFQPLGYILSTALLCIYETAVFETGHWVRNVVSGVAFAVGVYFIFVNLLEIMLPVGLLGWGV